MINYKNNSNYKAGMTLIEIIVVLGIFGILAIAISSFQRDILINNKTAFDSLTNIQDARSVIKTIVKELRSVSNGNNGAFAIAQAATNTITFFCDTDGDGLREQIRYFISNSILSRGSVKPTGIPLSYNPSNESISILAYNIKASTSTALFEYYDSNYMGTSSPLSLPIITSQIRLIKINLMIDSFINKVPIVKTYTSQVSLRNLKDNL